MTPRKAKPRKPKDKYVDGVYLLCVDWSDPEQMFWLESFSWFDLSKAKQLREWLDKAIRYLEARRKQ